MTDKLLFALAHYVVLMLFAASCWGYGQILLGRALRSPSADPWMGRALCICTGMGVWICGLLALALTGALTVAAVIALATAGWLCGAGGVARAWRAAHSADAGRLRWHRPDLASALAFVAAAGVLAAPLRPPHAWDELAYHLPHAREWAEAGALVVNEWLRYPWFPYNIHLLFAAGLLVYDDVMPHLVHALTGLLTALMLYRFALREHGRAAAFLSASAWVWLSRAEYVNAYIDMAVTLFVLAAFIAFQLWREQPAQRVWLAVAAFMLGIAVGSKYQALSFLPLLAAGIAWVDRRPRNWLLAAACLLVPCVYWYARNALLTGDPFNPLGGRLFGFSDWNPGDLDYQLTDIRRVYGWPPVVVWVSLGSLFMKGTWQRRVDRSAALFCVYAFTVWMVTSHYPRYLMPAYPLLAFLGAKAAVETFALAGARVRLHLPVLTSWRRWLAPAAIALTALLIGQMSLRRLASDWARVAHTPEQRLSVLRGQMWEYIDAVEYLWSLPQPRIYQNGMEAAIYYAPRPVRGDHFGPWRYRDYVTLPPAELAAKLRAERLDTLVLRLETNQQLLAHPGFATSFQTLKTARRFGIYRVNPPPP